jgi:nitroreductase
MVIEAILKRRSIRKYLDDEVPPDHIKDIIEAPMYAPTAWGKRREKNSPKQLQPQSKQVERLSSSLSWRIWS